MAGFLNSLRVEALEDGRRWKVLEEFEYFAGSETSAWRIVVPEGFVTDFASVPRICWSVLSPYGRYSRAAVVHDYLYSQTGISRIVSDAIFAEAMGVLEVATWRRWVMYLAVRFFGGFARSTGKGG